VPWSRSTRSTRSGQIADEVEIRVVGCLIEKQRTTPDVYPLSLNALRVACNQSTNRDPVVDYDEATVVEALRHLALRGWTRLASGPGGRARKYRHLLDRALDLDEPGLAVLAVLMLRGPQTPGELKQRTARMYPFTDLAAVQATLEGLVEAGHVARHPRRPGQKEERFEQLLGEGAEASPEAAGTTSDGAALEGNGDAGDGEPVPAADSIGARVKRLEADLSALRGEVASLREALGG
jgi:uncharacterized protein YceH (UPF0502 family)